MRLEWPDSHDQTFAAPHSGRAALFCSLLEQAGTVLSMESRSHSPRKAEIKNLDQYISEESSPKATELR